MTAGHDGMTPYYADDWLTVYHGDARAVMAEMRAESVHCVVTSPPYWGLRDYGQPDQLGREPTPEAYVANMVAVFREVRRVLRKDGTLWLNLGDSYAAGGGSGEQRLDQLGERLGTGGGKKHSSRPSGRAPLGGLKPKDLVGIPWRVAFALQADGWYLRSDIIWSKPNPMPESVTDRPTKSHEYLFLLSKSARYWYDADAVREASQPYEYSSSRGDGLTKGPATSPMSAQTIYGRRGRAEKASLYNPAGRNLRSVWTVATQPYPGAHFATFPPKLIEPAIKAGTSERGVCPECGAPWERQIERGAPFDPTKYAHRIENNDAIGRQVIAGGAPATVEVSNGQEWARWKAAHPDKTTGWKPSCGHDTEPIPATVLDPFAGSGTTGMVAQSLSRRAVLIDLSMDYLGQLMERNAQTVIGLTNG